MVKLFSLPNFYKVDLSTPVERKNPHRQCYLFSISLECEIKLSASEFKRKTFEKHRQTVAEIPARYTQIERKMN